MRFLFSVLCISLASATLANLPDPTFALECEYYDAFFDYSNRVNVRSASPKVVKKMAMRDDDRSLGAIIWDNYGPFEIFVSADFGGTGGETVDLTFGDAARVQARVNNLTDGTQQTFYGASAVMKRQVPISHPGFFTQLKVKPYSSPSMSGQTANTLWIKCVTWLQD